MGKKRKPTGVKDELSNNGIKKAKLNENSRDSDESSDSSSDSDVKKSESDIDSNSDSSDSEDDSPKQIDKINSFPAKRYEPPTTRDSSSSDSYHSDTEEEDKKQRKKRMKVQSRRKLNSTSNDHVKEEFFEMEVKHEMDEEDEVVASHNDDVPDWPVADYSELIRKIESQIPAKDNQKFDSRAAKLDWEQIAFDDYTPRECADTWNLISKRIRRFRVLQEMLNDAKEWVTRPWTNFYRGPKKNRHPDMPTRPLSTYMIYYLEQKDKVAEENPGMDMTQVSRIISEMYKDLSKSERDKYAEKAAKDRTTFGEKLSEFYKEHPEMVAGQTAKASSRSLPAKGPSKATTPFKLYLQEQLKLHGKDPNLDKRQFEEESREKWKNMNDKKKLVWINWSLEDVKRYEDELKLYKKQHPDFVAPNVGKSILNKEERLIKERLAGKPIKPPNSAYSLFSRICLQSDVEVKSVPPKLRMAEISRKWRDTTETDKRRYEEMVKELQDKYKLEFASYLEGLTEDQRTEELEKNQPRRKLTKTKSKPPRKRPAQSQRTPQKLNEFVGLDLYKGEPAPPPLKPYELFLKMFLLETPTGTSEIARLQEAPKFWENLPESKKLSYTQKLKDMKKKYIANYELFLKSLSPEDLKEFSARKNKSQEGEQASRLSDSNESDSNSGSNSNNSDSNDSSASDSEDSDRSSNM